MFFALTLRDSGTVPTPKKASDIPLYPYRLPRPSRPSDHRRPQKPNSNEKNNSSFSSLYALPGPKKLRGVTGMN